LSARPLATRALLRSWQAALLQAVRAVEHTLTIDEARRNSLGESLVFVSEHHPLSKPLTQLQDERAAAAAAADGAPPKPPRRIALTMKVSRGVAREGSIACQLCIRLCVCARVSSVHPCPPLV
jgi:hypothetical protein